MTGKSNVNWLVRHAQYYRLWNTRTEHVVRDEHFELDVDYAIWYQQNGHLFMTPEAAAHVYQQTEINNMLNLVVANQQRNDLTAEQVLTPIVEGLTRVKLSIEQNISSVPTQRVTHFCEEEASIIDSEEDASNEDSGEDVEDAEDMEVSLDDESDEWGNYQTDVDIRTQPRRMGKSPVQARRFPFQCHPHPVTYQQVLVEDDHGVNGIFNMLDRQYGFVGAELYVGVKLIRSHRDVFPIQYANEGLSVSFSYSHGAHFHNPYATHIGHYFEDAVHSPINIGGVDYHASYTHVAIEDQHVPYQSMNTSDVDYANPTEHVTQETTNDPNDTHRIATTIENAVHTLSERMRAMDNNDQLDDDEVLDDIGDEQEPLNEAKQPSFTPCSSAVCSTLQSSTSNNSSSPVSRFRTDTTVESKMARI
ncbi:hypothetical protein CFP56_041806 [Quercus suber]|uniref:Polyprotein n=1 Tax=Quercus suber TaxID=58331 RepID=A0AAW0IU18_QUESU